MDSHWVCVEDDFVLLPVVLELNLNLAKEEIATFWELGEERKDWTCGENWSPTNIFWEKTERAMVQTASTLYILNVGGSIAGFKMYTSLNLLTVNVYCRLEAECQWI